MESAVAQICRESGASASQHSDVTVRLFESGLSHSEYTRRGCLEIPFDFMQISHWLSHSA